MMLRNGKENGKTDLKPSSHLRIGESNALLLGTCGNTVDLTYIINNTGRVMRSNQYELGTITGVKPRLISHTIQNGIGHCHLRIRDKTVYGQIDYGLSHNQAKCATKNHQAHDSSPCLILTTIMGLMKRTDSLTRQDRNHPPP